MDPKSSHSFEHHEEEEFTAQQQNASQNVREFASPEELLRHDAAQTIVPPAIEERLQRSLAAEPKPPKSWWQRLLGR